MEIIVGYLFGVLYLNVCCLYSLESPHIYIYKIKEISLNYLYTVFGGYPYELKNVFDSSMVNESSGFEPLKFYCKPVQPAHLFR